MNIEVLSMLEYDALCHSDGEKLNHVFVSATVNGCKNEKFKTVFPMYTNGLFLLV